MKTRTFITEGQKIGERQFIAEGQKIGKRQFIAEGHLIDSGIFSKILNTILEKGGDYTIQKFQVGKKPDQFSSLEITVTVSEAELLQEIADRLTDLGAYEAEVPPAQLKSAEKDAFAPDDFYSTTNHITEVFFNRRWNDVLKQRMDAILVWNGKNFICTKLRDLHKGDPVVCGSDSIRVFPPAVIKEHDAFSFMSNDVSSERSGSIAVSRTV